MLHFLSVRDNETCRTACRDMSDGFSDLGCERNSVESLDNISLLIDGASAVSMLSPTPGNDCIVFCGSNAMLTAGRETSQKWERFRRKLPSIVATSSL